MGSSAVHAIVIWLFDFYVGCHKYSGGSCDKVALFLTPRMPVEMIVDLTEHITLLFSADISLL